MKTVRVLLTLIFLSTVFSFCIIAQTQRQKTHNFRGEFKTERKEGLKSRQYDFRAKWKEEYSKRGKKLKLTIQRSPLKKTASIEAIPSAQRSALIALYNSTNGDSWTNNAGWKTPPLDADGFAIPGTENTWAGITVNADHVESIILSSNNLKGSLPSELGNLSNLVTLFLAENCLTGSIPLQIGNLANLEELVLNVNSLSGPIPSGIADPGDLPALWGLDISHNNFSGNIPTQLGNLSVLIYLYMDNNDLTGSVPAELGDLAVLEELDLHGNDLDGIINNGFADPGDLPRLEYLDLGRNFLTGTIPPGIGNFSSLIEMYLDGNELTGNIPAEIGNLTLLEYFDISFNNLDGVIESGLCNPGDLASLEYLIIEENQLTGNIPAGIGNLSNLKFLVGDNNRLDGNIPSTIGNLVNLRLIYLYENFLDGPIPAEIGNLAFLYELDLSYNELNGSIPNGMADPGELPLLVYLDLSTNQLTGSIPGSFGNLANLQLLALVENQLDGNLPAELGDLANLEAMFIFDNKFTGIEVGMLEPGDLPNLDILEISLNELSGTIPTQFENLPLYALYINGNKYSGAIPAEIMNMPNLDDDYLDIRWNSLYATNPVLKAFLDVKQEDGDWESTQTIAPLNLSPAGRLNSVSYIQWNPIPYTADAGGYDVYYSAVSGGPYTFTGSANGKTTRTYGCIGFPEHSSGYFVVKARTNAHSENNNVLTSEYSNETLLADMNYSSYPEVVTNTGFTINEGNQFLFSDLMLKAKDEDAQTYTLQYSIVNTPTHGSLEVSEALSKQNNIESYLFTQNDIANGKVKYIHNGDEAGEDSFTFIVSDIEGHQSQEKIFTITITEINDPPVIDSLTIITMQEDVPFNFSLRNWYSYINDPDDSDTSLVITITSIDDNLFFTYPDDTTCLITTTENYFGIFDIMATVKDQHDSTTCETKLVIEPVNDLPFFVGLPYYLELTNGTFEILDLVHDALDIETPDSLLTFSFISEPDSLNIDYDPATKIAFIRAKESFDGTVELTVTVTDAENGSRSKNITIEVMPDPTRVENQNGIPSEFILSQNYPNPFNPTTVIRYGIPRLADYQSAEHVTLKVYDLLGNQVATLQDGTQSPGYYEREWSSGNVSSGIYLYVLQAGSYLESKKMILLK